MLCNTESTEYVKSSQGIAPMKPWIDPEKMELLFYLDVSLLLMYKVLKHFHIHICDINN